MSAPFPLNTCGNGPAIPRQKAQRHAPCRVPCLQICWAILVPSSNLMSGDDHHTISSFATVEDTPHCHVTGLPCPPRGYHVLSLPLRCLLWHILEHIPFSSNPCPIPAMAMRPLLALLESLPVAQQHGCRDETP